MSTFSTAGIYELIRARALGFASPQGATAGGLLGNRFYFVQPPDDAAYPHCVMNVLDRSKDGEYNGIREVWQVELQLLGRPRSALASLEYIADIMDEAFRFWSDPSSGLVFSRGQRARSTLPPFDSPADREVCVIRAVHTLVAWPRFLTQLDVPS